MSTDLQSYREFIAAKGDAAGTYGFAAADLPKRLFHHQRVAAEYAAEKGRAALFLDTGLGKSGCEVVFADICRAETNKPSLILTPLAVARQMVREAEAFGVEARVIREPEDVWAGVNVCNYERLAKLDASVFGCVVLDESSILKSFTGPTKRMLCETFAATPYRLAATATPAPNDHMELGNHSEFLGVLPQMEMLCRWFINDTKEASQDWRLKKHAAKDFWRWVASWSRAASLPSDLGGEDSGFLLPPLKHHLHVTEVDVTAGAEATLFRIPDNSATSIHAEKKLTLEARCADSAAIANAETRPVIVWCERDDESNLLTKLIPDAIEVKGSMPADAKERALDAFTFGERRVIVTKSKLAGFGLNWQHAPVQIFASISHSYESYYQAVRRSWRFGQKSEVDAHIVLAQTELGIWANVTRKANDHDRMKAAMAAAMREAQAPYDRREVYGRPLDFEFPQWLRSETDAA